MGQAGDYVRKVARDAVRKQMQNMAAVTQTPTPFLTIGCLTPDGKHVTLADGSTWDVVIAGTICGRCGPVTRMNSTTYYMVGRDQRIIQVDQSGKKGYILTAGSLPNSTHLHFGPTIFYASDWPTFTIFDIQSSGVYYEIPQDPTFSVFASYSNPDIPTLTNGHDGRFWAAFGPGMSQLAIMRINYSNEFVFSFPPAPAVSPTTTIVWTVLKGLGLNSSTNSVTWTSVVNGTVSVPWVGTTADDTLISVPPALPPFNFEEVTQFQYVDPLMWWDSDGTFHFDLVGNWNSQITVRDANAAFWNAQLAQYFYGIQVDSGGSLVNVPGQNGAFGDSGTGRQVFYTDFRIHTPGRGFADTGTYTPAFHNPSVTSGSQTADLTGSATYQSPYGSDVSVLGSPDPHLFDTTRTYPVDPLWTDIFPDGQDSTGGDIKVTGTGSFRTARSTVGSSAGPATLKYITWRLNDYSWNTLIDAAASGQQIQGVALIEGSSSTGGWTDHGRVGSLMDWTIK